MKSRALASIALGAAVILGATGCSMISPQATTIKYSAAEGINIPDESGPVKIRNVFIVADESGKNGNLIGYFVNDTDQDHTVNIQVGEGADSQDLTLDVPAETNISLGGTGSTGEKPLLIEGLNTPVGSSVQTLITSGGETVPVKVVVFEAKLSYFKDYAPEEG